jgi:hypothetical protein
MQGYETAVIDPNSEKLFLESHNVGINFDKYADIPVSLTGENAPLPISTFAEVGLSKSILENIERAKYTTPTPVQKYSIPCVLGGRDIMVCNYLLCFCVILAS